MTHKNNLLIIFLFFSFALHAQLKVASVLGSNMVLQRNTDVKIWGKSSPGAKVVVNENWNNSTISTNANEVGEWLVKIRTTEAGGPYIISVKSGKEIITIDNILLGEVWLCSGQSNMEMPVKGGADQPVIGSNDALVDADNSMIRLFNVAKTSRSQPQDSCKGKWNIANAETIAGFSAVGYFFAKQLQRKLNVPVGIICASWGASRIEAWISKEYMAKFPEPLKNTTQEKTLEQNRASNVYNGMIYPIRNYVIKGALWYQGESNRTECQHYAGLMGGLAENWRNDFNIGQFPFYFVQIAPFYYYNDKNMMGLKLREEQLKASLTIPNCGMVCTTDIGDEMCIHPPEKEVVAKRLLYWALAETYKIKGIRFKNTYFKNAIAKDSAMVVSFENGEQGLTSFGKEISNFEIAGEDKTFYPAKAVVSQRQVHVTTPEVPKPIAVRYAYSNFPKGTGFLYNTSGLPVPAFRSDDW